MQETPVIKKGRFRLIKLLLKIVVTAVCIWYVSGKIDFPKAGAALREADWLYLLPAVFFFILSKVLSAVRLNIYFSNIGVHLPWQQNMKLYWLGMFYNLFLPGSISGDAYKVVVISKRFDVSYRKTTAAVLLDRFSGLLGLGLILAAYSAIVLPGTLLIILIILGATLSVLFTYFIVRRYLKDFIPGFWITLFWGVMVQVSQVICAYLIMAALGIPSHITEYIFIFLVSSVAAVLPLTIGGLGIREVVFLEGSRYFGLMQENSVVISILFYLITLITSSFGAIYIFRKIFREKGHK